MRLPLSDIRSIVGDDNLSIDPEDLYCYSFDASRLSSLPDCVVHPGNREEIQALVRLANRYVFPIFPRGAGSGMVGASIPSGGGVVLTTSRLNRILDIDADEMIAVVEPGVTTGSLKEKVLREGLFYPPDPASLSFSTIGGNVATGAGGPQAVKYGVTRDYVLGLEVVLPTGEVIETGSRSRKGGTGYDLTGLMVGSEGTLGIFTKIILRLIPAPEGCRTLIAAFPSIDDAAKAVSSIIRARIIPSTIELMDQAAIRVVEDYLRIGLPVTAEAILLIEIDGRELVLDENVKNVASICSKCKASRIEVARNSEERDRLWLARRSISPALGKIKPGKINEDVTVPRTKIPTLIRKIQDLARRYKLIIVCFGHAGDGNIHVNIMLDGNDPKELRLAEEAVKELFRIVLNLGGTLSGEHGIGLTKSPFLQWEIGSEGIDIMWRIKHALDPNNILNPGKMFVPNRAFFIHDLESPIF